MWDYVFRDFPHHNKDYVFMTNLSTNISVKKDEIKSYLDKGYELGYVKPYIHCRTQKNINLNNDK